MRHQSAVTAITMAASQSAQAASADPGPTLRVAVCHNLSPEQYEKAYPHKFAALGVEVVQVLRAPFTHQNIAPGADVVAMCTWQMSHALGSGAKKIAQSAGLRLVILPQAPSSWAGALGVERIVAPPLPAVRGQESAGSHASLSAAYVAFTTEVQRLESALEVAEHEAGQAMAMTDEALAEAEKYKGLLVGAAKHEAEQAARAEKAEMALQRQTDALAQAKSHEVSLVVRLDAMDEMLRDVTNTVVSPTNADLVGAWRAILVGRRIDAATKDHALTEAEGELRRAKSAILGLQEEVRLARDAQVAAEAALRDQSRLATPPDEDRARIRKLEADLAEARALGTKIRASAGPLLTDEARGDIEAIQRLVRRGHITAADGFHQLLSVVTGATGGA